ncbi:EF-hand domain-containing protein [Algibacter aquimarinus]|uniref:EF-hand domain-containing protein n=1 Tax=Algibacter aquimarinus TaxID=1136748 RepID=A0ABP9H2R7_9FLAO
MKTSSFKIGILALALFAFSTIQAQEKKEPNFEKMLKRFDADNNGSISLEEFKSAKRKKEVPAERLEKNYARLDTNNDGALTLAELKENWIKRKEKNKKKQDQF